MMKIIMEKNSQLRQMETKMEKMIKERENTAKISMVPLDVVPITTIPTAKTFTTNTIDGAKQFKKGSGESLYPNIGN